MPEWEGFPIHTVFRETLPAAKVIVDNDANVMALGELMALKGAPRNIIYVKIGT
ncbi:MAG: transcriptional regulator, partial [Anaerolineae bacterium]|nr:transcriptional regulator [Anaerolineae bacterium]